MVKTRGFTIVELLIVIVVIAILAAISIAAYNGIQDRSRKSYLMSDISAIKKAMEMYRVDNSSYPQCPASPDPNQCSYLNIVRPMLVPTYTQSLSSYDFPYVRLAADGSYYGMLYTSNSSPYNATFSGNCKFGFKMVAAWYGSAPECSI
jgi:prepilin-type N-terminal cleavage/methylation domain-containing protein